MTKEEAVDLAIGAVRDQGSRIDSKPIWSDRFEANSRDDPRAGWIVGVPISVPKGFDPSIIFVEVFEPDRDISIQYTI